MSNFVAQGIAYASTEKRYTDMKRDAEIMRFQATVEAMNFLPSDATKFELRMIDGASTFIRRMMEF